jgi:salicylate hydroxylase
MNKPHVLIVGAGLGGLTAGIALVQRGFAVDIFEAASALREVGAGLTVSRSAQAVFAEIGLLDKVRQTASLTSRMAFLHYKSGRILTGAIDASDGVWDPGKPKGAIHIHRADMHELLAARFTELAPGRLHLGKRLTDLKDASGPVQISFADGSGAHGDLLIGADGVRSVVCEKLWGGSPPRFTEQVAYRFMVPDDLAAPFMEKAGRAALFVGPGRVFTRYTLRGGKIVNCVAITQSQGWPNQDIAGGWSTPGTIAEMLSLFDGWHPDVTGLMAAAPPEHLIKWALYDRPPLPSWQRGRITLLGDAAHPMLPFLGLGAAMAIEDGMVLARALEAQSDVGGLALYEQMRIPRVNRIAELSRIQGELTQTQNPDDYNPETAPAQDDSIQTYDPVTVPFAVGTKNS